MMPAGPIVALLLLATSSFAADWPQWRGPNRDGASSESSGWPRGWPPTRLWSASVGPGCSSPIVAAGRVYVLGWSGDMGQWRQNPTGRDVLRCLDAGTGKIIWQASIPAPYQGRYRAGDESQYGGPSGSPTLDHATGLLFTLGNDGQLNAWDTRQQGRQVWSLNLYDRYQAAPRPNVGGGLRDFGYTGSPLVIGEQVIIEAGSPRGTVVALSTRDGAERWRSEHAGPAGHTSGPIPMQVAGRPALAVLTLRELLVLSIQPGHEGRTLATYPWATDFACNIPTPAVFGDHIILTSQYNQSRSQRLLVRPGSIEPTWTSQAHSLVSTPLVLGGEVCFIDNSLRACDVQTGQERWRARGFGHGSAIATADNKIIVFGRKSVALLDPAARDDASRELARVDNVVPGTEYPHLALSDGRLLVKDRDGNMVCLSLRPDDAGRTEQRHGRLPVPAESSTSPVAEAPAPPAPKMPGLTDQWPGTDAGLVFAATIEAAQSLQVRDAAAVLPDGEMRLDGGALIADRETAGRLLKQCQASHELTLEAVIFPIQPRQTGPARILSFSLDGYQRNFTLGQEQGDMIFRLRTSGSDRNGMKPQVNLGPLRPDQPQHVVVTYQPGRLRCYVDGQLRTDTDAVQGDLSNWEPYTLLLGNEFADTRPWRGQLSHVAVFSRAVSAEEAAARYKLVGKGDKSDD